MPAPTLTAPTPRATAQRTPWRIIPLEPPLALAAHTPAPHLTNVHCVLPGQEDPTLVDILLNTKIIDERDFKEELQKQLEEIDNDDDDDDDDDE